MVYHCFASGKTKCGVTQMALEICVQKGEQRCCVKKKKKSVITFLITYSQHQNNRLNIISYHGTISKKITPSPTSQFDPFRKMWNITSGLNLGGIKNNLKAIVFFSFLFLYPEFFWTAEELWHFQYILGHATLWCNACRHIRPYHLLKLPWPISLPLARQYSKRIRSH